MPAGPLARKGIIGDFDIHKGYTPETLEEMGYKLVGNVSRHGIHKDTCIRYDKGISVVTLFKEQDGLLRLERLVDFEFGNSYGL